MAHAAPRSTPLDLVSAAVAGEDLGVLAAAAAEAVGRPVAIVIPALGEPLAAPSGSIADGDLREIEHYAGELVNGGPTEVPPAIADALPIRIGEETVGVVVAPRSGAPVGDAKSLRAWLDGTAAAASVTALVRSAHEGDIEASRRALLQALRTGPPDDAEAFASHARQLGFDLSAGAAAIYAQRRPAADAAELPEPPAALIAELGDGRLLGLIPVDRAEAVAEELTNAGLEVAVSAPRRGPAALHDALREAELLLELGPPVGGRDETYRLLVGVLFRDPDELQQLCEQTIAPLTTYDAEHDTELLATLQEFLRHHGSTTETAEAMRLHRHTVGYRLARVHEVSGLSPYESEGRERLSLGLKARQILAADQHLATPRPG